MKNGESYDMYDLIVVPGRARRQIPPTPKEGLSRTKRWHQPHLGLSLPNQDEAISGGAFPELNSLTTSGNDS